MSIRAVFLLIFAALLALMAGVFYVMTLVVGNQADVTAAEHRRYESYKLADALRQSSDDLTRMARTYVVTGDPAFEQYFQRVLAIRNGEAPRPTEYDGIYWDFVTAMREAPGSEGPAVSLQALMREMQFTDAELAKLREAQDSSDALVALEEQAMAAVKGLYPDENGSYVVRGKPDLELARRLLHGGAYHRAKADIMAPIQQFFTMVEQRTSAETEALRSEGRVLAWAAIGLMATAAGLLILSYVMIRMRVVTPVRRLAAGARRVARGEYGDRVDVAGGDELGQLAGAFNQMSVAIASDVEERRRSAAELARAREEADTANRAKSAFLANMSHELRTPMNAIIGYSEMMAEELQEEELEQFVNDVQKINTAGKHLLSLINDILDLSKIEAGRMDLYLEQFEVAQMLQEAMATVQPLLAKNRNRLETDIPDDLGTMRADLTKVRQSLFNLLSNASKFTEEGTVTVAARRTTTDGNDTVVISVSDTGIGIPEDRQAKVFEEFSQADASTSRNYGGTGLGLPISRRFCQMMGGDITLTGRAGEGSTFTITLPAHVDPMDAARRSAGEEATEQPGEAVPRAVAGTGSAAEGAPTVLVIDDDENVRDLLQRTLERDGYRVVLAGNGAEGLELARRIRPSAITLDIMMPSMDGWSVLRKLKSEAELRQIPVVVVSIVSERKLGFTLGATDYLTKPVDRGRLLQTLQTHCSGARRALVIEDDESTRELLYRTLSDAGFETDQAANGAEGLEHVASRRPGVILLDLMMPVMDGFEFLRRLRQLPEGRELPVLVLTAKELSPDELMFLERSARGVFDKQAVGLDQVLASLREAVAGA